MAPGDRVLLKVNALRAALPERWVSTHPEVVRAMIRLVRDAGGVPWVGDSSGGATGGRARTRAALEATGIEAVTREEQAILVNLDAGGIVEVESQCDLVDRIQVARAVLEADLVVSMAKLKTHGLTLMTGAIKNMLGVVPGLGKTGFHHIAPKPSEFAALLVEVFRVSRARYGLMDAVEAMEGMGPSLGTLKPVRLILGSQDCVALDTVCCSIMGLRPGRVHTSVIAAGRGLGVNDLDHIDTPGVDLSEVKRCVGPFRLPPTGFLERVPERLGRLVVSLVESRLEVDEARCRQCGMCEASCPAGAMHRQGRGIAIDPGRCIKCLCCQELCPEEAVRVKPVGLWAKARRAWSRL
jgi:uncharacterized protein (DUF362 family)/NAD-dependent dihydropyrimidine dehydrogenase PreA subunit